MNKSETNVINNRENKDIPTPEEFWYVIFIFIFRLLSIGFNFL